MSIQPCDPPVDAVLDALQRVSDSGTSANCNTAALDRALDHLIHPPNTDGTEEHNRGEIRLARRLVRKGLYHSGDDDDDAAGCRPRKPDQFYTDAITVNLFGRQAWGAPR